MTNGIERETAKNARGQIAAQTRARSIAEMVPMPANYGRGMTVGGTISFALCASGGAV